MSAPLAGKFQDHYAVLGIEPKSDSATIQRAYATLAQKYFPKNPETGDVKMFEAINMAYETLSDPELRSVFDKLKGLDKDEGGPKFSGIAFFDALGREAVRRSAILCVLYDRRLIKPSTPSLSMRHLELMVEATAMELASAIWYLKQRGLVASDDKSSMQITVDGMDHLESHKPRPEDVMPFIKGAAGTKSAAVAQDATVTQPQPRPEQESVLNALNRALARPAVPERDLVKSPAS